MSSWPAPSTHTWVPGAATREVAAAEQNRILLRRNARISHRLCVPGPRPTATMLVAS